MIDDVLATNPNRYFSNLETTLKSHLSTQYSVRCQAAKFFVYPESRESYRCNNRKMKEKSDQPGSHSSHLHQSKQNNDFVSIVHLTHSILILKLKKFETSTNTHKFTILLTT